MLVDVGSRINIWKNLSSNYETSCKAEIHPIRVRPLSLTVRTEVSYSLMTSAQAVDILRYEFDSHRRQTSLLYFRSKSNRESF